MTDSSRAKPFALISLILLPSFSSNLGRALHLARSCAPLMVFSMFPSRLSPFWVDVVELSSSLDISCGETGSLDEGDDVCCCDGDEGGDRDESGDGGEGREDHSEPDPWYFCPSKTEGGVLSSEKEIGIPYRMKAI